MDGAKMFAKMMTMTMIMIMIIQCSLKPAGVKELAVSVTKGTGPLPPPRLANMRAQCAP